MPEPALPRAGLGSKEGSGVSDEAFSAASDLLAGVHFVEERAARPGREALRRPVEGL